jgi:hypothetical protein
VPGGSILHGVADTGIPFRDLATAIGERLALGPAQRRGRGHFAFLLDTIARLDVPATSEITRTLTGWKPARPGLLEDVRTAYELPPP